MSDNSKRRATTSKKELKHRVFVVGSETQQWSPKELARGENAEDFVSAAEELGEFELLNVNHWSEEDFGNLLHAIPSSSQFRVKRRGQSESYDSLFDLVLHELGTAKGEKVIRRRLQFTILAGASGRPTDISRNVELIWMRLKEVKYKGVSKGALRDEISKAMVSRQARSAFNATLVKSVCPSAPVADGVLVPPGWSLGRQGVTVEGESQPVITTPVVIVDRLVDIESGKESVTVCWQGETEDWTTHTVSRSIIASPRTIIELADYGMPINSINAEDGVAWLADLLDANRHTIPISRMTTHLGWTGDPETCAGFLLGEGCFIDRDGNRIDPPQPNSSITNLRFFGSDEGDYQLAGSVIQAGTLEGWLAAVKPLNRYPRVQLAVICALCAPLLAVIRAANLILDFAGQTSRGKTSTLRVAASVYGNPDETSSTSFMKNWDATYVWIERALAILRNLPLILDDTQLALEKDLVNKVIYMASGGQSRGRASEKGTRRTGGWRTALLSSGEASLQSFSKEGGAKARIISHLGTPFPGEAGTVIGVIQRVMAAIRENYGQAGVAWIEFIIRERTNWPTWREEHARYRREYEEQANGNVVLGRMAESLAMIRLTARLARQALNLPWREVDHAALLWPDLVRQAAESDRASEALKWLVSWSLANLSQFQGKRVESGHGPIGELVGVWTGSESQPSDSDDEPRDAETMNAEAFGQIAFVKDKLEELLNAHGFNPDPVIRTWTERNYLEIDAEGRNSCKRTFQGCRVRMYCLTPCAVIAALK